MSLAAAAGLSAVAACVPVPQYDSKTDEMLTGLQKDSDTFIAHLAETYDTSTASGKACAYSANLKSYSQFRVDLGLLKTRAAALYDNKATSDALVNLATAYDALENAHKVAEKRADHCILPELLVADQRAIDSAVGALLKLELAKKGP